MDKSSSMFALLCTLAIACSVMYIASDGDHEYVQEIIKGHNAGTSVMSTDVLKAGQIYSETPDGRMRLMDYFNNVEKEISDEVANRKSDIASVRAQMARDFAFNAAARSKLKRQMLHKMAVNAKKCRDDLNDAMRKTQERFAKQSRLANRRWRATRKRDARTLKMADEDKREQARNLKLSVTAWQRATAAWASATNARIDRMNKHVAANAAQIKENAKKARKDLEVAMASWDHKIMNFRRDSKAARSRLSAQFAAQDKATRAWASNKIKALVAGTAEQFRDVRTKMAKNRAEVDAALKAAAMRFDATLNAQKALEDQRYAQSVRDISAAREEAKHKTQAAKKEFKVALLSLRAVATEQVHKVNVRVNQLAGTVNRDRVEQAKVNASVDREIKNMIQIGTKRYKQHLKNDIELQRLIQKGKAETNRKLNKLAMSFDAALSSVRAQLARDRKHAEGKLKKATSGVWSALYKAQNEQAKKNAKMEADIRRMRLDQMDKVRHMKRQFHNKVKGLSKVVAANDRKANKKIEKLTGVVNANEMKSRKGRQMIAALEEANKSEMRKAIRSAIQTGEKRAQLVEKRGAKMDKDTRWLINNKLSTEISKLQSETDKSIEFLELQSKEAREEMRKEMLYAIRTAAKVAKDDLNLAVRDGQKKMQAFLKLSAASHKKSAVERRALADKVRRNAKEVSRMIRDAVATRAQAVLSLQVETAKKIKKSNMRVDAHAKRLRDDAKKTRALIKAQTTRTLAAINTERQRAKSALGEVKRADAARFLAANKFLRASIKRAEKESSDKFGKAYERMAKNRSDADKKLAGAVSRLNDSLAKQAALADSRFSKTVKDLGAARNQAEKQVAQARKDFSTMMLGVKALVKDSESRLQNQISVVSGELQSYKANQLRVNRAADREIKRIKRVANIRYSRSKRARGKLKMLMDENKAAANEEVKQLGIRLNGKLNKMRASNHRAQRDMQRDLTQATKKLYERLAVNQKEADVNRRKLGAATAAASLATRNALKRAKAQFVSKINLLTNTVARNARSYENKMGRFTGVVHNIAKAAAADRKNIRMQTTAMEADMHKAVTSAIQNGEARAKAVEQRINEHLKHVKRYLMVELSSSVDRAADKAFKAVSGNRQTVADNYLSLKAYAVAQMDELVDYVKKGGRQRNLSSIGDLLMTVGVLGAVKPKAAEGLGFGGARVPSIFSAKQIRVPGKVATINGLVNEFMGAVGAVRARWPMGLGKYLLDKLEVAMLAKGVLQVDKVNDRHGNFVYVNGHTVGLSNKLSDFAKLACRMSAYEGVLAKLTAKITAPGGHHTKRFVKPPEWQGK